MAAPAVTPAAPGNLARAAPLLSPDLPGAHGVKPPAEEIAALRKMLRRVPPPLTSHLSSSRIFGGSACLEMLDGFHLPYSRLDHVRGIKTPVSVKVPIGGIRYRSWGKRPLVADCRFVVALEWIAPVLKQIGVTEVRYIGTYSYRMARVGRLSLHAYGLAIDIAGMVAGGRMHKVSKAFTRGMGKAGCSPAAPVLDQVGCRIKAMGLFREVLTPDSNADHASHFHFGVLPIGMTLAMLPRYVPGHRRHHHKKKHETKLADRTAPKRDDAPEASGKLANKDDSPHTKPGAAKSRGHRAEHSAKHAGAHEHRSAKREQGGHPSKHDQRSAKADKHASRHHHSTKHDQRSAKADKHASRHHHSTKHGQRSAKASHRTHQRAAHPTTHKKRVAKRAKHAAPDTRHFSKHHAAHSASRHEKKRVAHRDKAHHAEPRRHRTAKRHHHHGRSRKSDQHPKHHKH